MKHIAILVLAAALLCVTGCKQTGDSGPPQGHQFQIGQTIYWAGDDPPPPLSQWEPTGKTESGDPLFKRAVKPEDRGQS